MDQENVNYFQQLPSFEDAKQEADAAAAASQPAPSEFGLPSEDEQGWVLESDQQQDSAQQSAEPDLDALIAEREQLRQERDQYATRMGAYEAQLQQAAMQQAAAQWDDLERQAVAYAKTLEYEQAIEYMRWFGQQRNEAVRTNANAMVAQANAMAYQDQIVKQFGLTDEDRVILGNDPRAYPMIAERIKRERDDINRRFAEVQQQVKTTRLSNQASQRLASNADRMGTTGRSVPPDWTKLSEQDQLRALWGLPTRR